MNACVCVIHTFVSSTTITLASGGVVIVSFVDYFFFVRSVMHLFRMRAIDIERERERVKNFHSLVKKVCFVP